MKKICVVTWVGGGNFGTNLQSYALCAFLKKYMYEVNILYYKVRPTWKNYIKKILWKFYLYAPLKKYKKTKLSLKQKKIKSFIQCYYNSPHVFTKKDFSKFINATDVFVTGSDQIWNTYYSFNPFFFLDFAGDKKRIAYASSIGTKGIKKEFQDDVKQLLSKFSHIGVREESAVKALKGLLPQKKIVQVLDPTFLLTVDEWKRFGDKAEIEIPIPQNYLLCYLIGNRKEYVRQVYDVKRQYGIGNVIIIPSAENPDIDIADATIYDAAGPLEFLHLLLGANIVCTDSFHATAISINAGKDFVEFMRFDDHDEQSQNSRIYDVLNHYGLSGRIYHAASKAWTNTIDYNNVQKVLEADRKYSIDYLINAIDN